MTSRLPAEAKPNELGLYRHSDKDILKHESKHFEVRKRSAHRPTSACSIRTGRRLINPRLEHNGAGVWKTELDRPMEWDNTRLMRRMGPTVEGFSDDTLEQIRIASGVEEDELRRLHVVNDPPPALLTDTSNASRPGPMCSKLPEQIRLNEVPQAFVEQVPRLLVELPRWPEHKSIELFEGAGHTGRSIKFGNIDALPANTLKISRAEVRCRETAGARREVCERRPISTRCSGRAFQRTGKSASMP